MKHATSPADIRFRTDVESCALTPDRFDHRAHVRLAYAYLTAHAPEEAADRMRTALIAFLRHHGVDPSKYHETITKAWILAVRHFMEISPTADSADAFIDANPALLDSRIMLTHYSAEVLFSPEARARFVEPDLDAIPGHEVE
jgi:hypothetical protein